MVHPAYQPSLFAPSDACGIQLPLLADLQKPLAWVLRMHRSTNLYYDLGLQVGNALMSFTMYNPPSLNPARWVRAKQADPQDLRSMFVEERLPEAGPTMPVERGVYVPRTRRHSCFELEMLDQIAAGDVHIELTGNILRGEWRLTGRNDRWLLCKVADKYASSTAIIDFEYSISSGKRLEEL